MFRLILMFIEVVLVRVLFIVEFVIVVEVDISVVKLFESLLNLFIGKFGDSY